MSYNVSLVMQSFGGSKQYLRAIFALWSFYAVVKVPINTRCILFTDDASFFRDWIRGLPVTCVDLSPERIKQMRGDIDFLHRIKICIIEEAFRMTNGHLLYADSDTFFVRDPAGILDRLNHGTVFMHTREYAFKDLQNLPVPSGTIFHKVLKCMEEEVVRLQDGSTKGFSTSYFSWNAGVLGLHRSHIPLLPDVYAVTNHLYRSTECHASEQYAFSLVLQDNCVVSPCDDVVYHYWYRVKKQVVDGFLRKRLNENWLKMDEGSRRATVAEWARFLPQFLYNHRLTLRDNAIQAFNNRKFVTGYKWALKAFVKSPLDLCFARDVLYHSKRFLSESIFPVSRATTHQEGQV